MKLNWRGILGAFIALFLMLGLPAMLTTYPRVWGMIAFIILIAGIGLCVAWVGYNIGSTWDR